MKTCSICNLWAKEYIIGIDVNGQTQNKSLNIFERVARFIFGAFKETHLKNVLRTIANTITLVNFTFGEGEALKVMVLFSKIKVIEGEAAEKICQSLSLVSHEIIDDQKRNLIFGLQYNPTNQKPAWSITAEIKDKTGLLRRSQIYFNKPENQILNVCSRHSNRSLTLDEVFDKSIEENMSQFLLHILKHSPLIKGIDFGSEINAKSFGFETHFISRETAPNPTRLNNLPPFSLDFILKIEAAQFQYAMSCAARSNE